MSLYEFNNEQINPKRISKITNILETKEDGKTYYYFQVYLAGLIMDSKKNKRRSEVTSRRNSLINEVNT